MSQVEWQRIEPTVVSRIGWRTVVSKTFRLPDGSTAAWQTYDAEGDQCACVIALTPDNQVVIARQYRPGPEAVQDELPGGMVDAGETPLQAATRELREETGYVPGSIEPLGSDSRSSLFNSTFHYFLARDCVKQGPPQLEDGEFVEADLITISQLIDNARTNKLTDSHAVLLAYDTLKQLQQEVPA